MPGQSRTPSRAPEPDLSEVVPDVETPAALRHVGTGMSALGAYNGARTALDSDASLRDRVSGGLDVASAIGDTPILSEAGKRYLPALGVTTGLLGATDSSKSTEDRVDSGVGGALSGVSLVAPRLSPHVAAAQAGWFVGGKISDVADSDYARDNGGIYGQDQYTGENRSLTDAYIDLLAEHQVARQSGTGLQDAGNHLGDMAEQVPWMPDWVGGGVRGAGNSAEAAHDWIIGAQHATAAGIGGIPTQLVDFRTATQAWAGEKLEQGVGAANDTIDVLSNPVVQDTIGQLADTAGDSAETTIVQAGDLAGSVANHLPGGPLTGAAVRLGSRGLGAAADKGAELAGAGVNALGSGLGAVRDGWRGLFD